MSWGEEKRGRHRHGGEIGIPGWSRHTEYTTGFSMILNICSRISWDLTVIHLDTSLFGLKQAPGRDCVHHIHISYRVRDNLH